MSRSIATILRDALEERHGLVLVAGAPGSGVTTTLLVALATLGEGERSVLTLKQAVQGNQEGIGARDRPAAAVSEVGRLRVLLRMDPDIIVLDRMHGPEVARLAVQASASGRLVVAGVAANNAVEAIAELRAAGIGAFDLACSLRAVIAQRLVRRLCEACRIPQQGDKSVTALLGFEPGTILFRPGGCPACGDTGYRGMTGVYEAVPIDVALRRLIDRGGDQAVIASHAFRNSPNLASAARTLALAGITTADEAIRISRQG
jgi:general secretion pathway protein E